MVVNPDQFVSAGFCLVSDGPFLDADRPGSA